MNRTEYFIKRIYEHIDIDDPGDLTIENVSSLLNLTVNYWDDGSCLVNHKNNYEVFINQDLSKQGQWQEFGHEMKHYFLDCGGRKYLTSMFIDHLENKANYFAYHFCVPTFMLQNLKGVSAHDIATLFNVEFSFALKRLEMYKNNMFATLGTKVVYR